MSRGGKIALGIAGFVVSLVVLYLVMKKFGWIGKNSEEKAGASGSRASWKTCWCGGWKFNNCYSHIPCSQCCSDTTTTIR